MFSLGEIRLLTMDTMLNLVILTFSASSLVLSFTLGILYFINSTKYLKYWFFHWLILTLAFSFLFAFSDYFIALILYSLLLIISAFLFHYATYVYLEKPYTKRIKLVFAIMVALFILMTIIPPLQILTPIYVFSIVAFYYVQSGIMVFRYLKSSIRLLGFILISFGFFNLLYPIISSYGWYLPWGYVINSILGISTVFSVLALHAYHMAVEHNGLLKSLHYKSYHDHLTGLHNREYLHEQIPSLLREEALPISVLFADLNTLKVMNDLHGHDYGDQMLVETANVFNKTLDNHPTIIRYGGDEFLVILTKTNHQEAHRISENIALECSRISIMGTTIGISIGLATENKVVPNIKDLIRKAEVSMYQSKNKLKK